MDDCSFCGCILHAARQRTIHDGCRCYPRPCQMVCAGTCCAMSASRLFHRRCNRRVRQSKFGSQILRSKCQEVVILYGSCCFGRHMGCLFLHDSAVVYEYLQTRRRIGSSHSLPLFRPCHQYLIHHLDNPYFGYRDGDSPNGRGYRIFHSDRTCHGIYFP